MGSVNLVQELRGRIKDSRGHVRAFGLSVSDPAAANAYLELRRGRFQVMVLGGTAASVDFDLSNPLYDTAGKLTQVLRTIPGYVVDVDMDMDEEFSSISLGDKGPIDCKFNQVSLTHRLFSDVWLSDVLKRALLRHNPSMSLEILPDGEAELVLLLAHSELLKQMATDATKRKGMGMEVAELIKLAELLERNYREDRIRLARSIQSPREADSDKMREGDIVVGKMSRRLRSGRMSAGNIAPEQPVLNDVEPSDIEDTHVYLNWAKTSDTNFFRYEVWRDTVPGVQRGRGTSVFAGVCLASQDVNRDAMANSGGAYGGLEPETTYFFRLYVYDRNGESTGSQVVSATTLPLRVRLNPVYPPTPSGGPSGTVVTLTFHPDWGVLTAAMTVQLGDKTVIPTITGPLTATFVVPLFFQKGMKDLRVVSPTGLMDVFKNFQVL